MNLDKILFEIGVSYYTTCTEIYGGKDSSVFKIESQKGKSYALRILSSQQYHQFLNEEKIIQLARAQGIKVPKVYSVIKSDNYSAMLMEWASGQTIFIALQERPENARMIGLEFGRMQAAINHIHVSKSDDHVTESWLTPDKDELDIYKRISKISVNNYLLHLDYHPLNVLTDGEKITAVIDWANASIGDYRFDIARTLSILRLEGAKHFKNSPILLLDFEKGYLDGYEEIVGPIKSLSLFLVWAGLRMKRDLAGKLHEDDYRRIDEWVGEWLKKS